MSSKDIEKLEKDLQLASNENARKGREIERLIKERDTALCELVSLRDKIWRNMYDNNIRGEVIGAEINVELLMRFRSEDREQFIKMKIYELYSMLMRNMTKQEIVKEMLLTNKKP